VTGAPPHPDTVFGGHMKECSLIEVFPDSKHSKRQLEQQEREREKKVLAEQLRKEGKMPPPEDSKESEPLVGDLKNMHVKEARKAMAKRSRKSVVLLQLTVLVIFGPGGLKGMAKHCIFEHFLRFVKLGQNRQL
jgi:hypothetical protein